MKTISRLTAAVLCSAALVVCAQTAAPAKTNLPAKASAKPARAAAPNLTPPASQEQLDAAERTLFGDYECEFNQSIHVSLDPKAAGYVEVKHLAKRYVMRPILSSTGALRLEDVRGQTLMLQIANKSMLMDVKAGKRLVDSCVHAAQKEFMKNAPATTPVLN
jgi:hypothetical protein